MTLTQDILVVVFQRGGADGLCELALYNDPQYPVRRTHPGTFLRPHGSTTAPAATYLQQPSLNDPTHPQATGLPPALLGLKPAYDAKELAFVHATGTVDVSRSHFDQQSLMERAEVENPVASPNRDGLGWLRRHLDTPGLPGYGNGFRALSISAPPVEALAQGRGYLPVPDPANFSHPTRGPALDPALAARVATYDSMYVNFGSPLAEAFAVDKDALTQFANAYMNPYGPITYPNSDFGKKMRDAAHVAKYVANIEAISVDIGGWDTHQDQGITYDPANGSSAVGRMDGLLLDLAASLEAFRQDMANLTGRGWCLAVMTEFGRTLDSNSSNGTDHGRGGVCMLMGTSVNGGEVRLPPAFPGLPSTGDLDVAPEHDMRHLQGEIAIDVLGHADVNAVVPSLNGQANWIDPQLIG